MNSGPVAVCPAIPGHCASSSSSSALSTNRILMRRLRRASWCALSLYLSFVIASPAGEKGKEAAPTVNAFVDIASTRLADDVNLDHKKRFDFGGLPVLVGATRQSGGA